MKPFILLLLHISLIYSQNIESINPVKISGGTGETIKIKGSGFGNENTGEIFFYSGTDNNHDYYHVLDSTNFWYYGLVWNDSLIITELPDFANSGYVFIKNKKESNKVNYWVNFKYLGAKWFKNCNFIFQDNAPNGKKYFKDLQEIKDWNSNKFSFSFYPGQITNFKENGINEIGWGKISISHALSQTKTYVKDGIINECDIILNSDIAEWDSIDFRIVMLHELGHAIGLDDLCSELDKHKVMSGVYRPGNKRYLSIDEVEGYNWIYGAKLTNVKQISEEKKMSVELQNYPNPFNSETSISFYISDIIAKVTINIYDITGMWVDGIQEELYKQGQHIYKFKNPGASGAYLCNLFVNNKLVSQLKMIAIK